MKEPDPKKDGCLTKETGQARSTMACKKSSQIYRQARPLSTKEAGKIRTKREIELGRKRALQGPETVPAGKAQTSIDHKHLVSVSEDCEHHIAFARAVALDKQHALPRA